MSLKRDYTRSGLSKLNGGPGGWKCPCCNPFGCHPRNMKALARRRVRRVGRMELQAARLADEAAAVDRAADEARDMDQYYQELGDQIDRDTWSEMDAYEEATGMKFVSEGHYHQHMAYLEWESELS